MTGVSIYIQVHFFMSNSPELNFSDYEIISIWLNCYFLHKWFKSPNIILKPMKLTIFYQVNFLSSYRVKHVKQFIAAIQIMISSNVSSIQGIPQSFVVCKGSS